MNIFWLDTDLTKCVQYYVDKHVVKMITEHVQLLSASSRLIGFEQGYKLSHAKHPCTLWLLHSKENWLLLYALTTKLHKEYQYRYGNNKIHGAYKMALTLQVPPLPSKGLSLPPLCMPEYCKTNKLIDSYRNYYIKEKRHIAHWTKRPKPDWWI